MSDKKIALPGNGVAAILAAIHARHEIPEFCGESIVDFEEWQGRYSAVSLSRLNATVLTVPGLIGCGAREACEARGMEVLGVEESEELGESIVLISGSGDSNREVIEAMWREFDAEFARAPAEAATLADRPCCSDAQQHAASREHFNKLVRFFARMSRDHGLEICSDVLVDEGLEDSEIPVHFNYEPSGDVEGSYVQISSGPTLHVLAAPAPPPSTGGELEGEDVIFASIESLGCTVFSFLYEPGSTGDFEATAESICRRHGLQLLGVCFVGETLECLAIVQGTRQETEEKVISLWRETEGTPDAPPKTAAAE